MDVKKVKLTDAQFRTAAYPTTRNNMESTPARSQRIAPSVQVSATLSTLRMPASADAYDLERLALAMVSSARHHIADKHCTVDVLWYCLTKSLRRYSSSTSVEA